MKNKRVLKIKKVVEEKKSINDEALKYEVKEIKKLLDKVIKILIKKKICSSC